ncbi:MAG TPA: lipocalin family protein, partial [Gillisia sp.]|nr:lipocalin family protein [Gillisia sp.]
DDEILGKWFVVQVNNSGALNLTVSECNKQSFIDFKADSNADSAFYTEVDGECTLEDSDTSAWSNEGNSRYSFNIPFEGIGSQTGRVDFNGSSSFTFFPDILAGQNTNIVFEKR